MKDLEYLDLSSNYLRGDNLYNFKHDKLRQLNLNISKNNDQIN